MSDRVSDVTAVQETVRQFDEALTRHDLDSALALCVDEVVFIGSGTGEQAVGKQAVVKMATALAAHATDVDFTVTDAPLDVSIYGDIAVVVSFGTSHLRSPRGDRTGPYRLTGILVRDGGTWRWRVHHGSEPVDW